MSLLSLGATPVPLDTDQGMANALAIYCAYYQPIRKADLSVAKELGIVPTRFNEETVKAQSWVMRHLSATSKVGAGYTKTNFKLGQVVISCNFKADGISALWNCNLVTSSEASAIWRHKETATTSTESGTFDTD